MKELNCDLFVCAVSRYIVSYMKWDGQAPYWSYWDGMAWSSSPGLEQLGGGYGRELKGTRSRACRCHGIRIVSVLIWIRLLLLTLVTVVLIVGIGIFLLLFGIGRTIGRRIRGLVRVHRLPGCVVHGITTRTGGRSRSRMMVLILESLPLGLVLLPVIVGGTRPVRRR